MKPMRLTLLGLALVTSLAACGGGSTGGSTTAPDTADVALTSVDLAFDTSTITVPAGEAFTLALVNQESMQHNVAIYTDSSASDDLFVGEFIGETTIVYDIPALEPGEYFFRCDLHPGMKGTLIVEG